MQRAKKTLFLIATLSLVLAGFAAGQENNAAPVSYTSVNELNNILAQLRQTSQAMQADLSRMRIDKWKTDSNTKRQTETNVQSVQRNLQSALPEIVSQLNNSPEDLTASFKLYRNLDALYDVTSSVAESAGAFGSKDDFQSLSNDVTSLENIRRSFGERLQNLASEKEGELTRLRAQVKAAQAGPPAPPKKVVVDDTEPAKKPAKKKKPASTSSTPPAQPSNPQ